VTKVISQTLSKLSSSKKARTISFSHGRLQATKMKVQAATVEELTAVP